MDLIDYFDKYGEWPSASDFLTWQGITIVVKYKWFWAKFN
jgi:hypothetical protein